MDVKATIPMETEKAEADRVIVRAKYDQLQVDIDSCTDTQALRSILATESL